MDEIDNIKNSIRQLMQMLVQRGEPLSDELKSMLAQVINHASNRIEQVRGKPPTEETPQGADLLWQISGSNPSVFARYMSQVPDPALNNFARNPAMMRNLIERFSQEQPPQSPIQVQGIEKAPLNSSNIWGFNYDPKSGKLLVRFQKGSVYEYEGVPPHIFRIFQAGAIPAKTNGQNQFGRWWIGKNPSLGASFYDLIRSGPYAYEQVA